MDASKIAQALYPLIMAEKTAGANNQARARDDVQYIGGQALKAFRDLYRDAWNEPRVSRSVLTWTVENPYLWNGLHEKLLTMEWFKNIVWWVMVSLFKWPTK